MNEPTEAELLAMAQASRERARVQGRATTEALRVGALDVTAAIVSDHVTLSPRCPSPWCRFRLMTEREQTRGLCDDCAERKDTNERKQKQAEKIPPEFRGHTLDDFPAFIRREDVAKARAWLDGNCRLLTIAASRVDTIGGQKVATNPTASGKTTLAAMVAASAAARGMLVHWVNAAHLDPVADERRAREAYESIFAQRSGIVVVDGFGKEMAGARPGTDIHDRRKGLSAKLPNDIHASHRKTRFVVTVDVTGRYGSETYGDAEMRRLVSERHAVVIVLTRETPLDVVKL